MPGGCGKRDGLNEAGALKIHAGPGGSGEAAEFGPVIVIIGAGHDVGEAGRGQRAVDAVEPEVEAVHLGRIAASFEIEFNPGMIAGNVDGGGDVAVEEDFALGFGEDATAAGGGDDVAAEDLLFD